MCCFGRSSDLGFQTEIIHFSKLRCSQRRGGLTAWQILTPADSGSEWQPDAWSVPWIGGGEGRSSGPHRETLPGRCGQHTVSIQQGFLRALSWRFRP